MSKKASDFDDFLIATLLADLFDPSGSDDFDFVSKKIVDGLIDNRLIKDEHFNLFQYADTASEALKIIKSSKKPAQKTTS